MTPELTHSAGVRILAALLAAECHLHPDTDPAAIRDRHRRDVLGYLALHPHATPEQVGHAVILPTWNVVRILAAERGEPVPYRTQGHWRPADRTRGATT